MRATPLVEDPAWYWGGGSGRGFVAETIPRYGGIVNNAAANLAASGLMNLTAIFLEEGAVVSNIGYVIGTAGSSGQTAGFVALYSDDQSTLMAQSAAITTNRTAVTDYLHPLVSPVQIVRSGIYYVANSFTATTMPDMKGQNYVNTVLVNCFGMKQLDSRPTNSGLGSTAPATLTGFTTMANRTPWFYLT